MKNNNPFSTFLMQLLKAAIAAVTVVLCSRWLGAEGRGELSLVLFWVNIFMIANEYVGGSSMANLMQRFSSTKLFPVAFSWSVFVTVAGSVFYYFLGGSFKMTVLTAMVALPLGLLTVQYSIYQGLALAWKRNLVQLMLEMLKLALVLVMFLRFGFSGNLSVANVVLAFILATMAALVFSSWMLKKEISAGLSIFERAPAEMFLSGFWSQNGHLVQFLNYRLSLYLMTRILGNAAPAGIYSNALLIADTIWIFANSFGTIAHLRILKSNNEKFRADLTIRYTVLAVFGTSIACLLMASVPSDFYTFIFGSGFEKLKETALLLIPSVLAVSASSLFSHYLHATNQFRVLFVINLLGLIIQSSAAIWLIPEYGLQGACIAANSGFIAIFVFLYMYFRYRNPGAGWHGTFRIKALIKLVKNQIRQS